MSRSQENQEHVLIAAGGTGGHIFPALAVMEIIVERHPGLGFTWLGSSHRMESGLIPARGIEFIGLRQTEIRRKLTPGNIFYNIRSLWYLARSITQSVGIIRRLKPRLVLTTGGFAAGAAGLAAWMTSTPLAIIESNAYPGITNRFLGKRASVIFSAYPEAGKYFPGKKTVAIVSPARRDVIQSSRSDARSELGLDDNTVMILAMGGSQGATTINRILPDAVKLLAEKNPELDFRVVHQCGQGKKDRVKIDRNILPESRYELVEFIEDVPTFMAAADVVVSRAGASTLSEIACRELPSILIPLPHSAENHQVKNARAWESAEAAFCIEEKELDASVLSEMLGKLTADPEKRKSMGEKAKFFGDPSAAEKIADRLEEFIKPYRVS